MKHLLGNRFLRCLEEMMEGEFGLFLSLFMLG